MPFNFLPVLLYFSLFRATDLHQCFKMVNNIAQFTLHLFLFSLLFILLVSHLCCYRSLLSHNVTTQFHLFIFSVGLRYSPYYILSGDTGHSPSKNLVTDPVHVDQMSRVPSFFDNRRALQSKILLVGKDTGKNFFVKCKKTLDMLTTRITHTTTFITLDIQDYRRHVQDFEEKKEEL